MQYIVSLIYPPSPLFQRGEDRCQSNISGKRTLLKYHLRPSYVVRKLKQSALHSRILKNYVRYGLRLIASCLKR